MHKSRGAISVMKKQELMAEAVQIWEAQTSQKSWYPVGAMLKPELVEFVYANQIRASWNA